MGSWLQLRLAVSKFCEVCGCGGLCRQNVLLRMSESASQCAIKMANADQLREVVAKLLSERRAAKRTEAEAESVAAEAPKEPEGSEHDEGVQEGEEEEVCEDDEEITPAPTPASASLVTPQKPVAQNQAAKCNSTSHRKEWMMLGRRVEALPREKFPECHRLWDGSNKVPGLVTYCASCHVSYECFHVAVALNFGYQQIPGDDRSQPGVGKAAIHPAQQRVGRAHGSRYGYSWVFQATQPNV